MISTQTVPLNIVINCIKQRIYKLCLQQRRSYVDSVVEFNKSKIARVGQRQVYHKQNSGHKAKVVVRLEQHQRKTRQAKHDIEQGYGEQAEAVVAPASERERQAGEHHEQDRAAQHEDHAIGTDHRHQVHSETVDDHHVVGGHAVDTGAVGATAGNFEVRLAQYAAADVQRRLYDADRVQVADAHEQRGRHDEMRNEIAVAIQLAADDRKHRMAVGKGARNRTVEYVGDVCEHVEEHSEIVSESVTLKTLVKFNITKLMH